MANRRGTPSKVSQGLRDRAEAIWQTHHRDLPVTTPEEVAQLVHELQVHEIELEVQNEELRRAQAELEKSREELTDLYDFAPVGYLTINQDSVVQQANLTVATMLGLERGRLVGERFNSFVDRRSQDLLYFALRAPGPSWSGELVLHKRDGASFPISMEVTRVDDDVPSWRCVVTDITARQAAEGALREREALRASEERYRGLAEQVVDGIFVADAQGHYLDANQAACELLGYALEELKALTVADVLAPEDIPRLAEQFRLLQHGEIVRNEWRFRRKTGSVFTGELVGRQLPDGRLQAVVRDITERKEAEEVQRRLHQLAMLPLNANMAEVLGAIVETAIVFAHADFGDIQLLDADSSNLHIVTQRGFPQWWIDYWRNVPEGRGAYGSAFTLGERVIVEDVEQSPIFAGADLDMQRKAGVRAVQSTPLTSRSGKSIGILSTHFTRPHRPDDRTLQMLDVLAREAADIIGQIQADAELKRQAALLDLAHDAIFVRDRLGRITYWNEGAVQCYGWSRTEALGEVSNILLQTQFPESLEHVLEIVMGTGNWEGELVQTCRDGRRIVVDSRWTMQRDAAGEGFRVLEIAKDITSRRQAESALRESQQQLQSYIDQAGDAIYVLDVESGRILSANMRAEQMTGYSREELLQLSAADLERLHSPVSIDEIHARARDGVVEVEGVHQRKDGSTFPVEIRLTSLTPPALHRVLSIVRDVSERKRLEQERAAETRRKDEFLAFLGHELRNPLAAVDLAIQVLSGGASPQQRTRMEDIIRRQTALMRRLVDDLLELERITHGHIELKLERLDLTECLKRAAATIQSTVASRGQELVLRLPSESVSFVADSARLDQIVGNLLTNASKYTRAGGRIELSGASEGSEVIIRCKDNGQGILPEDQRKIFEAFTRGRKTELGFGEASVGLGLALVKQLTELHGGTISVESGGAGLGSEFTLRLPIVTPSSAQAVSEPPTFARATHRPRSIVIVEDNPSVAAALQAALEQAGHTVSAFASGPSALAGVSTLKPDAVVIDIGLPGMDGYELLTKLRQLENTRNALCVAVSGLRPRERTGQDGDEFDQYFSKPVDVPALLTLLDQR
jgi:PAS domain S-box-containing protein